MKIKLITHIDLDGIGCKILLDSAFPADKHETDVTYANYDDVDGKVMEFLHSVEAKDYDALFITDISVSDETAEKMDGYLKSGRLGTLQYRLFDHHKTAEGLNKYDWCTIMVELPVKDNKTMLTCGTELFYFYLCANELLDSENKDLWRFVSCVRDWDTWRWKNEEISWKETSKQLNDLFTIYGRKKFIGWALKNINSSFVFPDNWFDETDQLLLTNRQDEIDLYTKMKDSTMIYTTVLGKHVGIVFSDRFTSEMGNTLCENHSEIDAVALINISNKVCSLRTIKDDCDVSEIARGFGGGGHKKAAAFTIPNNTPRNISTLIFGGVLV